MLSAESTLPTQGRETGSELAGRICTCRSRDRGKGLGVLWGLLASAGSHIHLGCLDSWLPHLGIPDIQVR